MKSLQVGDPKEALERNVTKRAGCWYIDGPNGPRQIITINKRPIAPWRYSYLIFHGELTKGMVVMHRCDNVGCVNPEHLRLGTHKENSQDCVTKNRHGNEAAKAMRIIQANQHMTFSQANEALRALGYSAEIKLVGRRDWRNGKRAVDVFGAMGFVLPKDFSLWR
jgi:hypothetical protein